MGAKFLPRGSLFAAATETRFRCRYANGIELVCEMNPASVGSIFEGAAGTVKVSLGGFSATPASLNPEKIGPNEI